TRMSRHNMGSGTFPSISRRKSLLPHYQPCSLKMAQDYQTSWQKS
ncbi:5759_t:CDS:1, partial [Gigaspora rosea]